MILTESMQAFILHWGEMGTRWGMNRSVAQIHALLHLSPEALPADDIAELLGIARSNASTGIKELQLWKLVKVSRKLGDRRDHFTSLRDPFDMAQVVIEGRRQREFLPTIEAVEEALDGARNDGTSPEIQDRMKATLEMMQAFDRWYVEVQRLPRKAQLGLLKLGAKVTKWLPKLGGRGD